MARLPRLLATACVMLLMPTAARAQSLADYDYENLTFRGIGFDVGYIWPDRVEPTQMWSLRLDLGYLGPGVRIAPTLSMWSSRLRQVEIDRLADRLSALPALQERGVVLTGADLGDIDWSDFVLGLDAHAVWTAPLDIVTFVGAGLGLHALNGRGDAIDGTFVEGLLDSVTAGFAVLAGVELQPLPLLRVYGEARYTFVSDVRYPGLRIGAALMLPQRGAPIQEGGR
jgi:opacity protein-like surface antigen